MKRKIVLSLFFIFLLTISIVNANTLKLDITTENKKIKKDEEITIKVSWNQKMQAADFTLNFDNNKLEYVNANIDEVFINTKDNKIKTSWASMDDTDKTEFEYKFKVKKVGNFKFTTTIDGGFADGNLVKPTDYKNGELIIGNSSKIFLIFFLFVVCGITLYFLIKKIKNNS